MTRAPHLRRPAAALVIAVLVACVLCGATTARADVAVGDLAQKPGLAACVSNSGAGPCADVRALRDTQSLAISPDGKSAYVTSLADRGAVALFDRGADGTLTQKQGPAACIAGGGNSCLVGRALEGAKSVTVSPDGKSVYVTASNGIAVFDRAADGTLAQEPGTAGCIRVGPGSARAAWD